MIFNKNKLFLFSQIYFWLAIFLFSTGYVLKDPMQNVIYMLYALTLPVVTIALFFYLSFLTIKYKSWQRFSVNLLSFLTLSLMFYIKVLI